MTTLLIDNNCLVHKRLYGFELVTKILYYITGWRVRKICRKAFFASKIIASEEIYISETVNWKFKKQICLSKKAVAKNIYRRKLHPYFYLNLTDSNSISNIKSSDNFGMYFCWVNLSIVYRSVLILGCILFFDTISEQNATTQYHS